MNEKIHFDNFVEQVALESGYDIDTAQVYVENMFETIIEESSKGRNIKIQKFGSFQPRWYKAKRGINPQTKQPLDILPHYHIHYAVAKGLEQTLNSGEKVTKITIDESTPNLFKKIVFVALAALLVTLIYRSFFMPETEVQKLPLQQTVTPAKEEVAPKAMEKEIVIAPEIEEPTPIVVDKVIPEITPPIVTKKTSKPILPTHYRVQQAETLSEIAISLYGKSIYWPLLFQSNQSKISTPDLIIKGVNLLVPQKSENSILQDAYLAAYKSYLDADKMRLSFWTLCSGARYMGSGFVNYLSKHIQKSDLRVVKRCNNQ